MHELSLCFILPACFSIFIAFPTNSEKFEIFRTLVCALFLAMHTQ